MTDKTQAKAHSCINPQCNPTKCWDCACAIPANDQTGHVVLDLLNTFAVNDLGHPFEDGDSAAVDRARQWLQNRSTTLQAAPPAPAAVAVPDDEFQLRQLDLMQDVLDAKDTMLAAGVERNDFPTMFRQYSALAAAPAQAVVVPAEVELPDVEDMAHSAVQEALSFGVNHDVFHRWMRAVMDKTVQALAAAPAQEHATQLAGQGQDEAHAADMQAVGEAFMAAIEDNYAALQGAGWSRPADCPSEIVADLLDLIAEAKAAPAQAQEDALDAAELREIQRAVEQFADCGETDVDYALLMRAAQAGYLECTHFQVMNESALNLDAAHAAQGDAA